MHHTQIRASMKIIRAAFAVFALAAIVPLMAHASPAGTLLIGTVKSADGARMNFGVGEGGVRQVILHQRHNPIDDLRLDPDSREKRSR